MYNHKSLLLGLSLVLLCIPVASVQAQLLPDNTLGKENSVINSINSLEDRIDGGAIRGSNLFHSFKEFNIGNNRSVYFSNPTNIENILTRITGTNQSNILGKLGVLGNANLFLINPNGIVFGKDASLDIKGSFVGSTASFIDFADGTQFSAVSSDSNPLLTISTPLGLAMGNNPGEIRVQGDGHSIIGNGLAIPFTDSSTKGLSVAPGKTMALIGGNIILEGGLLKTQSGRIELGSLGSGQVDFNFTPNLQISYDKSQSFQDIQLSQSALIDAKNFLQNPFKIDNSINQNFADSGSIRINAKQLSLIGNSFIFLQNQGNVNPGSININATESLEINNSTIRSQSYLTGKGGNIAVYTKRLAMKNSSFIGAFNYGLNSGGNIDIKASDSIELIGSSLLDRAPTNIATNTFTSANGGNINISTNQLKVTDGAVISSTTFNEGHAGDLTINASEFVEVIGSETKFTRSSILSSLTFGSGDGGNLTLNTRRLTVKDGGRVDASTASSGAAGSITINASDKVELAGISIFQELIIPSRITSSADVEDKSLQEVFGIPLVLTGNSGSININTNQLNIRDGAFLAVKNDGSGNAGKLQVKADYITINNQGIISAATTSGRGGGIDLEAQNLILRRNGNISATAGAGDGGNISINAQIIAALENSDITANSQGSFGGQVVINAKGVLGTQFREFSTPESDITATSGKGAEFNGVVDINTITINPNFALAELPTGLTDSSNKIAAGCGSNIGNNFIVTGRGGNPDNPNQLFTVNNPIVDLIDLIPTSENQQYSIDSDSSKNNHQTGKAEIIEAKGWIVDSAGNIEFVAEIPGVINNSGRLHSAGCQLLSSN